MLNMTYSQKRFGIWCLIIMVLVLFFLKVPFVLKNPFFIGDSGIRMYSAHKILVRVGNRLWLPFLQLHIWAFHKLRLAYYVYKFIPCFYFFLALLFLGKLAYRLVGRDYSGLIFSLLLLFCFAYQPTMMFLNTNLYQEMLAIAFFYIMLYKGVLDLRKQKFLLVIASIALLTRDTFWIYLLVLSLFNYKKILSDKTYLFGFMWLWAIPLLWIGSIPFVYLIKYGGWPKWPWEWPLMVNIEQRFFAISNLFTSLKSLGEALAVNKIPFLISGLVIAWFLKVLYLRIKEKKKFEHGTFDAKFKIFSLTSLAIIYSLVLLFNPWDWSYGNMRMGVPLLYHLYIWVVLFYKETFDYPKVLKTFVRLILILSILLTLNSRTSSWFVKDYSHAINTYSEMERLINNTYKDYKPSICIIEKSFYEFAKRFIAPTLYFNSRYVKIDKSRCAGKFDVVIATSDFEFKDKRFLRRMKFRLKGKTYTVYSKQ